MGTIADFFSSVNIITLIAFFLTLVFIVFEFRLIIKSKSKPSAPQIPKFDPSAPIPLNSVEVPGPVVKDDPEHEKKMRIHKMILPVLIVLMIIFGAITFMDLFFSQEKQTEGTIAVQEIKSSGIKIYKQDWSEIAGNSTEGIKAGDTLHIGIGSVRGSDIDQARIKVNEPDWKPTHITAQYDQNLNIYYTDYMIKVTDNTLDIEAQLHSKSKGWLSE